MRNAAVLLCSTVAAGTYASTAFASHQCVLDLGPSSLHAAVSSLSSTLAFVDRYEVHQYTEIALHYLDGTKNVISATGHHPKAPGRHLVSSPRAQDARPYKATWTRIRYVASSLSESPCAEGILSEKVNAISVHALPTDTSASTGVGITPSSEDPETSSSEQLAKQLGSTMTTEDMGYEPIRRRATLGELCQLLVLFMVLGALHYASMQMAARWQAPPPMERRSPQCE
ncbi:hypothetical protein ACGC1H_002724 [Rhizoctonia solani]|uniref:GOLD domain-containing protein n=1 Tax=Rhizoctonia solani TaxID=456999 RepID=A0A8H3GX79_9AGAM|nr:unnamed protein product [Rhizoctonia solani]